MSKLTLTGAAALVAAPVVVFIGIAVAPTVSDDAAEQVAALTDHRSAMIVALALETIAIVLLLAGTIWFAYAVAPHAPRLALAGGILAVVGSLVVLFEDGVDAAAPPLAATLDPTQATAAIDAIGSSAAVAVIEPWTLLQAVGLALLAVGAVRSGVARWAAVVVVIGAFGQVAGFATETRSLILVGFALLFVGLVAVVRALVVRPAHGVTQRTVTA